MKERTKRTKRALFAAAVIAGIALALIPACKDGPDSAGSKDNPPPPQPIEVTIAIPAECANLNQTKPVTILFPATFTDTARQNVIKGKFVDAMSYFNTDAGTSSSFKTKINAILDRGLTITMVETISFSYGAKVVNNQVVVETAWIEDTGVDGKNITGGIIYFISKGQLQ